MTKVRTRMSGLLEFGITGMKYPVAPSLRRSRDDRRRREIARHVERRREQIGERIDRDENADPLGRKPDGGKERREHDEGAARNARHSEREEDRRERNRRQLACMKGHAVKPSDEERTHRP